MPQTQGPQWEPANVTNIAATFGATGQSASFRPAAGRPFNVSIWGTFVATVQLERSFDDGSTWVVCSRDSAGTNASYTAPASLLIEEPEAGVLYRLNCAAYTSGTVSYRISQ